MQDSIGGFRTLTELAAAWGYSRTHIRKVAIRHGVPIRRRGRCAFISPTGQKRLREVLPPRSVIGARAG